MNMKNLSADKSVSMLILSCTHFFKTVSVASVSPEVIILSSMRVIGVRVTFPFLSAPSLYNTPRDGKVIDLVLFGSGVKKSGTLDTLAMY